MASVISIINLKGGVGKTTITVALAEFMALHHQLKVLVIDLDPQTNATMALMDEYEWKKRNIRGQTVVQIFRDRLQQQRLIFNPQEAIVKQVSNIGGGIPGLDLLPSSLDLIDLQDDLTGIEASGVLSQRPLTILGEVIAEIVTDYDVVLIDCPPNLGLITQNGLVFSQYYLIPVIPDILSTYGIPQIVSRVRRLVLETGITLQPLGVVINKYRTQSTLHRTQSHVLHMDAGNIGFGRVFDTVIPESTQAAAAMDFTVAYPNLHGKYGYQVPYQQYRQLTDEVLYHVK
ncbi:MAG: ParA family protein [Syntrophomonadaceae bacterium]|jgi:chromosome partitioning protein